MVAPSRHSHFLINPQGIQMIYSRANFARTFIASLLLTCAAILQTPGHAETAMTRDQIETVIREYLLANPEILGEMQLALEQKQKLEADLKQKEFLKNNMDLIANSDYQIEFGDPQAPVTVIEFFDYNCHYCQRAMADMQNLLQNNKKIRFVLREFPVLGEQSIEASRVSLAFSRLMPEKYAEFHLKLLGLDGVKNGDRAIKLATEMGADEAQLRSEMEKPAIIEAIGDVYQIADPLGITGTPSYVVGDQVVFGAVGYDRLSEIVGKITTQ